MKHIDILIERYPCLSVCKKDIENAALALIKSFENAGKLLVAGNGGSCADSDHITGELLKSFVKKRTPKASFIEELKKIDSDTASYLSDKLQGSLPAIALTNNTALMTASLNDVDGNILFAQQVNGYGNKGDVFLGISTSGNSKDIVYATVVAKAKGLVTIALSGRDGGKLKSLSDISIVVPETETYKIQELHLPVYHALCLEIEEYFWKE
jgi:D-sedoheptulose 7-phosphate isomerase